MKFKTKPFASQLAAFNLCKDAEYFALLMEQGTGKSKVIIDNAAHLYGAGRISALVVVSPNGVQRNWITDQVPVHMPDYCHAVCAWWSSTATKKERQAIDRLFDPELGGLRVICFNIESLATERGYEMLHKCLTVFDSMLVVDESHRIKNPKTKAAKALHKLGNMALFRRILSGTPVTQGPMDLFSQFYFLDKHVMGTQSFVAFKATYCELLAADSGLMRHIAKKSKFLPQIVAKDKDGKPRYRNLDQLQAKIAPHSYRVRKDQCLDLPPKLYSRIYCELTPTQRNVYDQLRKDLRTQIDEGKILTVTKLTLLMRLQQVVGGFGPEEDETFSRRLVEMEDNPRLKVLMEVIESLEGGVIIYARFRPQIADIVEVLSAEYGAAAIVQLHGGIKPKDRTEAIKRFQAGEVKFFVCQQASAIGITLTAARSSIYYSNDFSLATRLQSEDRNHRIGQHNPVTYYDIEAVDTIDSKVINSLINKKDIADVITGDPKMEWL